MTLRSQLADRLYSYRKDVLRSISLSRKELAQGNALVMQRPEIESLFSKPVKALSCVDSFSTHDFWAADRAYSCTVLVACQHLFMLYNIRLESRAYTAC